VWVCVCAAGSGGIIATASKQQTELLEGLDLVLVLLVGLALAVWWEGLALIGIVLHPVVTLRGFVEGGIQNSTRLIGEIRATSMRNKAIKEHNISGLHLEPGPINQPTNRTTNQSINQSIEQYAWKPVRLSK
jgi:hypothetical protein